MPFKLQGSSTSVLQPCYDGRVLPITHQVASEGLALLSIKDSHRDCSIVHDPASKVPSLSCTDGIKPRNSFWNVHKPDLRKIRGLQGTTTDNVIELFQTHNMETSILKIYTQKIVSKLGSIYKKARPSTPPQALVQNVSWPINCCILSSICQETEMAISGIPLKEETEKTAIKYDYKECKSKGLRDKEVKDTVFLTLPQSNMRDNTSDDLIPVAELLNPSTGDSFTNTTPHFNMGSPRMSMGYDGASAFQPSSSIVLESKQSQHQISIPSNVEFYKEKGLSMLEKQTVRQSKKMCQNEQNRIDEDSDNQEKIGTTSPKLIQSHEVGKCDLKEITDFSSSKLVQCDKAINNTFQQMTENPFTKVFQSDKAYDSKNPEKTKNTSSIAVQSIFSDIFEDIEDVKDVINSYMSSFYVQEEEYNNFPKRDTSSRDVVSHFYEQIYGPHKDKNCNPKNVLGTFCHNFEESNCTVEQSEKRSDSNILSVNEIKIDDKPTSRHDTTRDTNKNDTENETCTGYCYWEDSDLYGEFANREFRSQTDNSGIPHMDKNKSVVTLEFIQNMWEEFINQVETHALLVDLVNKNHEHDKPFPSYGHWSNMYDPNIFQEAENIVQTLDSLLMNGCFPTEETNISSTYMPCTIVEIIDEIEFSSVFEEETSEEDKTDNNDRYRIERECNQIPYEYKADSSRDNCRLNHTYNENGIYETNLEPVLYQEKLILHNIGYSRVPQYEQIKLDPIDHSRTEDFTICQSYSVDDCSSKVEINPNKTTEQAIQYVCGGNSPKEEIFLDDISKDQSNLQKNDIGSLVNEGVEVEPGTGKAIFEKIQDINSPENSNPAFLFSSPTLRLNLTNPFMNTNKK